MLEAGDVHILRDYYTSGTDLHYQIVINKTAANEFVVVYATSKIDKAKLRCMRDHPKTGFREDPPTYVDIPEGTCESHPELCTLNCDKAFLSNEADRESGIDFSKKAHKLPKKFLDKIEDAVKESFVGPGIVFEALSG